VDVSLKEYFEALLADRDLRYQQRFDAQSKAIQDALTAAEKAVVKAEVATEKRFEGVNEFRQTLSDQAANFISRKELWGYIVGAIGAFGVFITAFAMLRK
jgi:hypothetical protein